MLSSCRHSCGVIVLFFDPLDPGLALTFGSWQPATSTLAPAGVDSTTEFLATSGFKIGSPEQQQHPFQASLTFHGLERVAFGCWCQDVRRMNLGLCLQSGIQVLNTPKLGLLCRGCQEGEGAPPPHLESGIRPPESRGLKKVAQSYRWRMMPTVRPNAATLYKVKSSWVCVPPGPLDPASQRPAGKDSGGNMLAFSQAWLRAGFYLKLGCSIFNGGTLNRLVIDPSAILPFLKGITNLPGYFGRNDGVPWG